MEKFFNFIRPKGKKYNSKKRQYVFARKDNVKELEKHIDQLQKGVKFYDENLVGNTFDYVFKYDQELQLMKVKFNKSNFPHLTGIDFANVDAETKYKYLQEGNNKTPIFIERNNRTIDKLSVIQHLPDLLKCNSKILSELEEVGQAQRLGFNKAIKNHQHDLLVGLKDFKPEIYSPRTLLNIKDSKEYKNVPENTILGIFKESDDVFENQVVGRGAGAVDINHKYIDKPEQVFKLVNLVSDSIRKAFETEQQEQKQKKLEAAKRAAFFRGMRDMRE